MKIYISGSIAYDRIMDFPDKFANHILPEKLHILNVCFLVNHLEEKFGGTAGNIAYSLSLLGEKPIILSTVGNDFEKYKHWMEKHGLSLEGIKVVKDVPTASAYIMTDRKDNQITAFNPGAMNFSTNGDSASIIEQECLAIVSPGNLEDMQKYPAIYRKKGIPFIFDPGQNIPAFSGDQLKDMIKGSKSLIVNDYELSLVMDSTGLDKAQLLELTDSIVTTLGDAGSRISFDEQEIEVPAVQVENPVDPTGAGDAFRSGFLKGLIQSKSIVEAAKMGSTCASFSVEHLGTQAHSFTRDEFWDRYHKNFKG